MPYAKAIAAFVVPLILTLLTPFGIGADTSVSDALYLLLTAAITGLSVYIIPNKVK